MQGLTGVFAAAQVQLAQLQQQSLATQVAQMRAQAKLNPGAMGAPGALLKSTLRSPPRAAKLRSVLAWLLVPAVCLCFLQWRRLQ